MALTTLLVMATLLVSFSDGYFGQPNGFNGFFNGMYSYEPALQVPQPPPLPPGFPAPPPLPQPPPLLVFNGNRFPSFPPLPPYPSFDNQDTNNPPPPQPPVTFDDIGGAVPRPGGSYQGFASSSVLNSDGTGKTQLLANINGQTVFETYDHPANDEKNAENNQ